MLRTGFFPITIFIAARIRQLFFVKCNTVILGLDIKIHRFVSACFPSFAAVFGMRKVGNLVALLCLISLQAHSQGILVNIRVKNTQNAPVRRAEINFSLRPGMAPLHATTDSAGNAPVTLLPDSTYLTDITATGYTPLTVLVSADGSHAAFTFTLQASHTLKGAVVTASRPLMRQVDDMTIVDPEPLAAASTSGYEILEKVPGVIADQDGNFFMTSSTPATIYINGRELKMSTSDIATMLKSLPPNSIDRIEILRTPSAKYDASGSGGIINVVLKKGVRLGVTGSFNAGIQQGTYGNDFGGASLNYNDGETTAYINLNYAQRQTYEQINTNRLLTGDSSLGQQSHTFYNSGNPFLSYGGSKAIGKKWDVSYDGRVSGVYTNNATDNRDAFSRTSTDSILSDNISSTINKGYSWNVDQSLNAKYKIDTAGSEWTTDGSWNGAFNHTHQDIYSPSILSSGAGGDTGTIRNTRHYFALQTDVKLKLKNHLTLETGAKSTYTVYHNHSDFTATFQGLTIPDPNLTTTFQYHENINAAYVQVSKEIYGITIKPGLRIENTNMVGRQTLPGDTSFSIHRTDLFPYLYISHKVMTIAKYELRAYVIYRRTILRPSYDYLNPYRQFIDEYTYNTGNPLLRPQFTQNVEANISIDERPLVAIGHNDVTDIFSQVVYQSKTDKSIIYRTYDNLGKNQEIYIRALGAIPPGKTYFFVLGGQININRYNGAYEGEPLNYSHTTYTIFMHQNLKLGKNTNITLNGFARFRGFMQFYELGPFGSLNGSVSHYFLSRKLMIAASAQDIFYTNQYTYSIDQGPIHATGSRYNDSRRFGINVRYNFGVKSKEEKKDFIDAEDAGRKEEEVK